MAHAHGMVEQLLVHMEKNPDKWNVNDSSYMLAHCEDICIDREWKVWTAKDGATVSFVMHGATRRPPWLTHILINARLIVDYQGKKHVMPLSELVAAQVVEKVAHLLVTNHGEADMQAMWAGVTRVVAR